MKRAKKPSKTIPIVGAIAIVVIMAGFVYFFERYSRNDEKEKLAYDADRISYYLWRLDDTAVNAYADILSAERGYKVFRVVSDDGRPFVFKVKKDNQGMLEGGLRQMGLIYESEFRADVVYDDRVIGEIELIKTNRNFYLYVALLLFLLLLYGVLMLIRNASSSRAKQRVMKAELNRHRGRLHAVVSAAPVITLSMNKQGRINALDGKALVTMGIDKAAVVGQSLFEIFAGVQGLDEDFARARGGETVTGIKNVQNHVYETWFSPRYRDKHRRKIDGVIGVWTDVTLLAEAMETIAVRERAMQDELQLAQKIHRLLTPIDLPKLDGFEFGLVLVPSGQLGGDFVNFHPERDKNQLGVTFCDITGHGIGAALLSSTYKVILEDALKNGGSLEDTFQIMNQRVYEMFPEGFFASTFHARFDADELSMSYVKAAQDPVYLFRDGNLHEVITEGAPVLGLMPGEMVQESSYQKNVIQLASGDTIFMFTDGLVEIHGVDGELLGRDRLVLWVVQNLYLPPQEMVEKIYDLAKVFANGKPIEDDITAMAVRVQ